ncbi:Peptidase family S41 [Chitinophaga sp. CF118]|uniref:S41 family peptidase n=1 Tax=Chitinophaga sp. CF118 TaxID=1884367 RepID=UPI0008F02636|nr:S41 family peptidase [Chitinophaga sp. CF118]SFE96315.1 Peptidase family S41 [Chitinophaga sp. CF118]
MLRRICYTLVFPLLVISCSKKDDPAPPIPTGPVTQKEVNNWLLDSMRYFYLWNDQLPATADTMLTTTAFFNQLKSKDDRFSFLYKPADQSTYPKYMLYIYGIDFSVINWPTAPGGAIGVVKLVIPGSVAALNGIQRGSYFTQINGTTLTSTNASTLSNALLQVSSAALTMATVDNNSVKEDSTITLPAQALPENPIYQQSTSTVNGKVVAYLFYNYFDDNYNQALVAAFTKFKNAGASELILDLRYNPGGSVSAAALINSLIAPGINEQSTFAKYSGNNRMGQRTISYKSALSVPESGSPIVFSSLSAARLSLSRVFILSGQQTASAAELTINTLKPYMDVIQIGQITFGKDKAAVIIRDARSPQRIPWAILPITYNLFNAKGTGGYTTGITPQYVTDEMTVQPLSSIGDNNDPLKAKAFSIISGNGRQTDGTIIQRYYDSRQAAANNSVVIMPIR